MNSSPFSAHKHPPSAAEIKSALGPRYLLWERLTHFIGTHYGIKGVFSVWGPKNSGWGLRYRYKGKALVALYPQEDRIMAQVVLGAAQAERALGLALGKGVGKILRVSPQLRDGRWLYLPVLNDEDAADVEQLLLAKVRPRQPGA